MKTKIPTFVALTLALAAAMRAEDPARAAAPARPADTPCRIIQAEKPQFPIRMLKEGVTHGTVRVLVHVDSTGAIIDLLVTAGTRQAFAEEAQRVIGTWTFEPTHIGGEALDTILDLTFNFDVNGMVAIEKFMPEGQPPVEMAEGYEYHACSLSHLDRMPTPLALARPLYPDEWREQGIKGRVTVQFYIDETGKARFPTVVEKDHDNLAAVAVAAVRQWRFAPPTSQGRPVLVRARQVFAFGVDRTPAT
ncbi:MAG: TonB family protein [Opitutaceae bacterium]|nr:TonB family protein [Opitutaceae bacterium]